MHHENAPCDVERPHEEDTTTTDMHAQRADKDSMAWHGIQLRVALGGIVRGVCKWRNSCQSGWCRTGAT